MQNKQETTANLSDDLKFLIACCQVEQSIVDTEFLALNADTPVSKEQEGCILNYISEKDEEQLQNLISLSVRHGILPLVYKAIKEISNQDENTIPPEFLANLKSYYMGISQRNMLMSAELIRIMKLLKENDIESLAFKGPALSQMAYGDITLRQFGDLDILIRKKDRSKMMNLLLQEQYIPEIDLKEETKETFFNSVNVIGLYNGSTGVLVEVHWELLSKNYAIDWEEKSLWNTQASSKINQKDIPVLSIEQHLLYLCAHGSKHLFERLEWICDIDRAITSNPTLDWELMLVEAEKLGIQRMLTLGLTLSQQFFRTELPETIQENITQDKKIPELIAKVIDINFSRNTQESKNYSTFALLWSMRETLSDQLCFAWRGMFAPKFDDFKYIQLPDYLSFLYPLVRPFRLVTKYFNANDNH